MARNTGSKVDVVMADKVDPTNFNDVEYAGEAGSAEPSVDVTAEAPEAPSE